MSVERGGSAGLLPNRLPNLGATASLVSRSGLCNQACFGCIANSYSIIILES